MDKRRNTVDWTNLLPELLDVILDKLFHSSDFIRFGAVCKSWHSVALQQKPNRIKNISKQSPIRLVWCPSDDLSDDLATFEEYDKTGFIKVRSHLRIYNVGEGRSYKLNLLKLIASIEDDGINDDIEVTSYGSSCGWLALQTKDISEPIRFCNPFNQKCIKVPPVPEDNKDKRFIVSYESPDNLVIAARLHSLRLAVITADETSWTVGNIVLEEEGTSSLHYGDIIFHKGLLYTIDYCNRLLVIDYKNMRSGHFPAVPVMSRKGLNVDITIETSRFITYLAESSRGNLLLVQQDFKLSGYETYELQNHQKNTTSLVQKEEEEEVKWVKVSEFKKIDTVSTDFSDTIISPFGTCFCIRDCNPDWLVWDTSNLLDEDISDPDKECIYPLEWLSPQLY